ncbi:MAG: M15 family metallopeptidase [Cyanobacteria bacterium J06634_6]
MVLRLSSTVPVRKIPPKDIPPPPPPRRQPTEISLEEIENLNQTLKAPRKKRGGKWFAGLLLLGGLGGLGYWQWDWLGPRVNSTVTGAKDAIAATEIFSANSEPRSTAPSKPSTPNPDPDVTASPSPDGQSNPPTVTEAELEAKPDTLLNHRRYEVADPSTLVPLSSNANIKVQAEVQEVVAAMIEKARIEGVQLGVISGYRTLEDQDYLYFDLKAERGQSVQTRAEVSAPPGYSEHHTGYAVDFIDKTRPSTNLSQSFDTTDAYAWIVKNAPYFNFELSFPKDNDANVSYEPWHWRYVGNQESLELFYK